MRQLASVSDITTPDRPDVRCFDGHHGHRVTVERRKFHFNGLPVLVNVDHRSDITGLEPFSWNRRHQHDPFEFADHLMDAYSGIST